MENLYLSIAVVFIFSALGFWRFNSLMFMLAAGASMVAGFYWYDVYTTDAGLGISLMIWAYSIICLGFAFMCIFIKSPRDL